MKINNNYQTALITGSAGFIGFYLSNKLLNSGWKVIGLDCLSDYYDVELKKDRERLLQKSPNYECIRARIEERDLLKSIFKDHTPEIVIHLAAQAGVRYSIENPRTYLESNIVGTFELLEAARAFPPKHVLMASTSSAYGAQKLLPYDEALKADHQMSFYAATKKSTENIAHSYSHNFSLPITMLRFFTVYGPWGRPDMAFFKFTKAILENRSIEVYNYGKMKRDFTYIDDLTEAIFHLIYEIPKNSGNKGLESDSLSSVAPFRVVNIGSGKVVNLIDYIRTIEDVIGRQSEKKLMPMQQGDVPFTLANNDLLKQLTGFEPNTNIKTGIRNFVNWYRKYYNI